MKKAALFTLVTLLIMPIFTICSARASGDAGEKPLLIIAPAEYKSNVDSLISAYKSHSGKKVEVEYVEDMEDYSSRVNVDLLSGKGPDIFHAGTIPFWDFAKKGLLADIGKLIEDDPDVDISDFRENIIDPLRDSKGRLYVMPCSYYFWIMQINVPLLEKYEVPLPEEWTLESVHKVCREFTEKTLNVPDVFAMLGGTREFWKTAMLNEISLAIDYVKNESHIDGIPDSLFEYARNIVEASQAGFFNTSDIPYVFTLYSSRQDLSFNRRNGLRAWLIFEYNDFEYRTFPRAKDGDNGVYYLENAFCINKNGDVKEAWEFIKFQNGIVHDANDLFTYMHEFEDKSETGQISLFCPALIFLGRTVSSV